MSMEDQVGNTEISDLEYTRGLRKQLVGELMHDGKMPDAQDNRQMLMSLLKDMDSQALARMKIKSDNALAKSQQATAQVMTNVLASLSKQQRTAIDSGEVIDATVSYDIDTTVPGETELGTLPVDIAKLTAPEE